MIKDAWKDAWEAVISVESSYKPVLFIVRVLRDVSEKFPGLLYVVITP